MHSNGNGHANDNRDTDADPYPNANADSNCHPDPDGHSHAHDHGDANGDAAARDVGVLPARNAVQRADIEGRLRRPGWRICARWGLRRLLGGAAVPQRLSDANCYDDPCADEDRDTDGHARAARVLSGWGHVHRADLRGRVRT